MSYWTAGRFLPKQFVDCIIIGRKESLEQVPARTQDLNFALRELRTLEIHILSACSL